MLSKLTFFLRKDFDPIIYDSVAALRRVPTGCLIVRVKDGAIIDHNVPKNFLKQYFLFFCTFVFVRYTNSLVNPTFRFQKILILYRSRLNRDVHVVLFSLLADQLSGQFLIFYGLPKENCPISESGHFFLSTLLNFCPVFFENVFLVGLLADQLSSQFLIF